MVKSPSSHDSVVSMNCLSPKIRHSAAGIAFAVVLFATAVVEAAEPPQLDVATKSGKQLTGLLDSRTDEHRLWVRRESAHIVLASPVAWENIVEAQLNGKPVEVAALKAQRARLASEGAFGFLARTAPVHHPHNLPQHRLVRITNIEIAATVANFDRDVEPDGLELVVAVVDDYGHNVPVCGTLSVRLVGERVDDHTGQRQIEDLQRWSQRVAIEDFVDGVAYYALPFRTVYPEFDLELGPHALVNVRLGAFGHGNYEASAPLPLRQFNPFRDRLQLSGKSRFVRDELTHNVRRGAVLNSRQGYNLPW